MLDVIFPTIDTLQIIPYFNETEWSHSILFCLQEYLLQSIMWINSMA